MLESAYENWSILFSIFQETNWGTRAWKSALEKNIFPKFEKVVSGRREVLAGNVWERK